MSNELLKYAFVAGELSPTLLGRTDLTKYDLAVAEAYNFFVDYRGGLSSRPGTEFVDFLPDFSNPTPDLDQVAELVPAPLVYAMKIEAEVEYNYLLVMSPVAQAEDIYQFDHSILRFVQNGRYDLEMSKVISSKTTTPGVITFTVAGHGFLDNDWVQFVDPFPFPNDIYNHVSFIVRNVTTNTFTLEFVATGEALTKEAASFLPSSIARVYTLEVPYRPEDYETLCMSPCGSGSATRDVFLLRITHPNYRIRNLVWRYNGYPDFQYDQFGRSFTLEDEEIGTHGLGPSVSSYTASKTGEAAVIFAVSSVYANDQEGTRGLPYKIEGIVNYTATEGSVSIYWAADPNAVYYNIYRSIVSVTETLAFGTELGFVGRTKSTKFTDPNIIPDFSRTPPKRHDPFTPGHVTLVRIDDPGSGYAEFGTTVTIVGGTATDFYAEAIVDEATGEIQAVDVLDSGHDYNGELAQVITISGGGAGAEISLDTSGSDNYPGLNAVFQQRQVYAASFDQPVTLWGSQTGLFGNFNVSSNVVDSDSFEFTINTDTFSYAPFRHLIATQIGLLCFSQESAWLVNGGGPTTPLTAQNVIASPQDYSGASFLRPLKIGNDLVYAEGKGYAVRMMSYSEAARTFTSEDKIVLSSHLVGEGKEIKSWGYQEQPHKVVWCVRADGALLAFTFVKSEDVFAWTSGGTQGQFIAAAAMRENLLPTYLLPSSSRYVDTPYFITQRKVGGRWRRMIERMVQREVSQVEKAWCVDCGIRSPDFPVDDALTGYRLDNGNWALWAQYNMEGNGDASTILYGAGGKFAFVQDVYDGMTYLYSEWEALLEPTQLIKGLPTDTIVPQRSHTWSFSYYFTTLSSLWHLEGETVAIVADGVVLDNQVVTGGKITLDTPAVLVTVGLPFTARVRTLPLTSSGAVIEGKRKRIVGLGVRLENTKGLKGGQTGTDLYDVEKGGEQFVMVNGIHHELVHSTWEDDASLTFEQTLPLPVTMLSLLTDTEVGDDTN